MRAHQDGVLGAVCVIAAMLLIFVWIPQDVESGVIEKVRSRKEIGDAMAPLMAACLLLFSGILLIVTTLKTQSSSFLSSGNLLYTLALSTGAVMIFVIMRWSGPVAVFTLSHLGVDVEDYRLLRDTPPWKYIGFVLGGTITICALIGFVERRLSWQHLLIGFCASLSIALLYDLPFDNLLPPPNGDV